MTNRRLVVTVHNQQMEANSVIGHKETGTQEVKWENEGWSSKLCPCLTAGGWIKVQIGFDATTATLSDSLLSSIQNLGSSSQPDLMWQKEWHTVRARLGELLPSQVPQLFSWVQKANHTTRRMGSTLWECLQTVSPHHTDTRSQSCFQALLLKYTISSFIPFK